MIAPVLLPVIRRAIIDLLDDIGGEHNDDTLTRLLISLGHRVARRDVADQLRWLAEAGLVRAEEMPPFVVARIISDGRDVAAGTLRFEGVCRHKTGD